MERDVRMIKLEDPGDRAPGQRAVSPLEPHGYRGRVRLARVLWAVFKLRTRSWLGTRSWFGGASDSSERRRLEGARLRDELVVLGPTFVKIGQTLSTRIDLLPIEVTDELKLLLDRVPPFPNDVAFGILERELGKPLDDVYATIDRVPIAAASIGQVYRARLRTGEDVVIKVQRPDLERRITLDLAVLRHLVPRFSREGRLKNVDWPGVIDEFERVIVEEMDYGKEVENAEQFRKNFAAWPQVYVPRIHAEHSSRRVITMEYIPGVKVDEHAGLRKMGLTPMGITELLVRTYLKQLLEDGFFHADPHPGNLRVMPDGRLAFFDFGMVGHIPLDFQSQLVDAFFHIVERDWAALTRDAVELGFLRLDPGDKESMDRVMHELLKKYEGVRLGEKDFQELHTDVANVLYSYPFQIPAKFTFILRAIMTLDGIGMKADPDFNFFAVAKPHAKEFMLRREGRYMGAKMLSRVLRREEGSIDWSKAWKLAKMAWKYYVDGR
jgi:predicted unusual protein kinase regulating ubiquinone biosynthesis (AarF/ABC1/UbiB family)